MSGSFNPINMVSQVALAVATGGASVMAQLAMQVLSQVGQQVIQQVGDLMGLPQSTIEMAQGALTGAMGDIQGSAQNLDEAIAAFGEQTGASQTDIAEAQRELRDVVNQQAASLSESEDAKEARASGGGKSWIMALAQALGEKLDAKAEEVSNLADQITDDKPSITAKFGAASQEFNVMMSAATTAIKTIGEGLASMAKRQ